MMEIVNVLRAKSKNEENHLLVDHIKETLRRAIELKRFVEQNKETIKYSGFTDSFFKDLVTALILHDLGKINFGFQKKVFKPEERTGKNEEWKWLKEFFRGHENIDLRDHEIVSVLYSLIFLGNQENEKKIRTSVLLHHYNNFYVNDIPEIMNLFDKYPDLKKYTNFLLEKKDLIKNLIENLLDKLLKAFEKENFIKTIIVELKNQIKFDSIKDLQELFKNGYSEKEICEFLTFPNEITESSQKSYLDFFVFLGALRRCDYSASGNIKIEENINLKEVYNDLLVKIKKSIGKENEQIWQEKILNEKDSDNLILVAPTGSGKTEFALLWAAKRNKKLIYTLPLRVALNDLFWRFKSEDERKAYFDKEFVNILHSTSFIEYLKGRTSGDDIDVGAKVSGAQILSSPLLLTTPDQVFLSSLKYYGFDKLLNVYPLSSIVIDEIQAYNPEMAAVVIKTLEIIKELNGDLLIITATFPPYFKKFLEEYPQLDLKEAIEEDEIKNYSVKRHKIKLIDKSLFNYKEKKNKKEVELEIIDFTEKLDEDGTTFKDLLKNKDKNILIIVNNVNKAIELFKKLEKEKDLKEKIYLDNLPLLLHSRIIENEKSKRISAIKEALKNGKKGMILIATQIVEASVDVDFDILITEISPIDSQIQRWGRIWRNRGNNHYNEDEPNIYIFTEIDRGTLAIYNPEEVLEKTIEVLKDVESNIRNPFGYEEEKELIGNTFQKILKNGRSLREFYEEEIKKNLEWLKYYSAGKRSEAQKIFRNIAGIQVFVPNLEDKNEDEVYKVLCEEVLKNENNWKLPLKSNDSNRNSIVRLIKDKIKDEKLKNDEEKLKWKILETLYKYSFNLPIFGLESNKVKYEGLEKGDFKGFFVLKENDKDKLKEIKKFGVSSIKDVLLDDLEIESNEGNIIE